MSYEKRGSYNHVSMARQLLRFDNLYFGDNVTPMDVDGLIEWHDKKRVLIEIKRKGVKMLIGEKLALERMVDDFQKVGKDSVVLVAEHMVFDSKEDVDVAECVVREVYFGKEGRWRPPSRIMTVRTALNAFLFNSV